MKKKGKKKHKLKWMKKPMAVPEVILEFLDKDLRENALRALANFLLDVSLPLSSTYQIFSCLFVHHSITSFIHPHVLFVSSLFFYLSYLATLSSVPNTIPCFSLGSSSVPILSGLSLSPVFSVIISLYVFLSLLCA